MRRPGALDRSISLREKSPKIEDRDKTGKEDGKGNDLPGSPRGSRSTKLPKRVINRRRSNSIGSGGSGEFHKIKAKLEREKRKEISPKRNHAKWDGWDTDKIKIKEVKEITEFGKVCFQKVNALKSI